MSPPNHAARELLRRARAFALSLPLLVVVLGPSTAVGGDLVVVGWASSNANRFDETTGAFASNFIGAGAGGLSAAHSIQLGPSGDLYVTSFSNNRVLRFDVDGNFISTFVTAGSGGLSQPTDAVFGPDGNLYVSSLGLSTVFRYNGATGAFLDVFVSAGSGGLSGGEMLAWGPDGNLYVASANNSSVRRYDGSTGAFIDVFVAGGSGQLNNPHHLLFMPGGDLLVTSFNNARVLRYDGTTGNFESTFASGNGLVQPHGLVYGPDGHLYVASFGTNQVLKFDGNSGAFLQVFVQPGSGVFAPAHLVFLPDATSTPAAVAPGGIRSVFPSPGRAPFTINVASTDLGTLRVFDLQGRQVRALHVADSPRILWDGRDANGQSLAAGTYVLRLDAGSGPGHKVLLLDGP